MSIKNRSEELRISNGNSRNKVITQVLLRQHQSIRQLENEALLIVRIQLIAEAYGARQQVSDVVLHACKTLIQNRFSMLSLEEISIAFRMAAAREFKNVELEVYGGVWNASILGKVLGAYMEYRRKQLVLAHQEQQKNNRIQVDPELIQSYNQQLYLEFESMIIEKSSQLSHWEDVPVFWYSISKKLKLLEINKRDAYIIYNWATKISEKELKIQLRNCKNMIEKMNVRKLLVQLENGQHDRAKVISQKVAVWVGLLGHNLEALLNATLK